MPEAGPSPLGLYVHLPWCVRKCPYCDFNSHALLGELPAERYVSVLLDDLSRDAARVAGRPVASVFIGGGTPSLFSGAEIGRLIDGIETRVNLTPDAEITLEANPGTVERDSFAAYRAAGVNRVSLGVQSFDDACLARIGRIHGRDDVLRSVESLHRAGLTNFNLDLMFGLPGQDMDTAILDIEMALAANPSHLSHYQLTLEPNTAFAAEPPADLPGEDACWDIQEAAGERLRAAGFAQYEVSAWSRPGLACRHNMNYWRFGDYLGIGAGAHGKLTGPEGDVVRMAKQRHPKRYLAGEFLAEERLLAPADLVFEFFLNNLRLPDGFRREDFERGTGLDWTLARPGIQAALEQGLLEPGDGGFRPTALGWRFGNDLQALFLP